MKIRRRDEMRGGQASVAAPGISEESVARMLLRQVDLRSSWLCGHSRRVAALAGQIAAELGLDAREQRLAWLAGELHDIGMQAIPDGTLFKPGPLTLEERRQIEMHPGFGELLLRGVGGELDEVATIVGRHHERIDGAGYPDRLSGDEIPLLARVVGVAEAFDSMTQDAPYRDAMPERVARLRLAQAANTQFDPTIVAALERLLARGPIGSVSA